MIMKKILILIAATVLFVACDKINPNDSEQYIVYSGMPLEWEEGTAFDAIQRAYVDKYTGPQCINCPNADKTLDAAHEQFGDNLVIISINHPDGQGKPYPNEPDMRTLEGTTWDKYYGIDGIPAAYINRRTATQYSGSMNNIVGDISAVLAENPIVGVNATAEDIDHDGTLNITAEIVFAQEYTEPLTMTLALVEDSLAYKQLSTTGLKPDYMHNHILRMVVTDVWGADIECTGKVGEARQTKLTYTVSNHDINLDNCHLVAFVSDKSSRQVLNSVQCSIAR